MFFCFRACFTHFQLTMCIITVSCSPRFISFSPLFLSRVHPIDILIESCVIIDIIIIFVQLRFRNSFELLLVVMMNNLTVITVIEFMAVNILLLLILSLLLSSSSLLSSFFDSDYCNKFKKIYVRQSFCWCPPPPQKKKKNQNTRYWPEHFSG